MPFGILSTVQSPVILIRASPLLFRAERNTGFGCLSAAKMFVARIHFLNACADR